MSEIHNPQVMSPCNTVAQVSPFTENSSENAVPLRHEDQTARHITETSELNVSMSTMSRPPANTSLDHGSAEALMDIDMQNPGC